MNAELKPYNKAKNAELRGLRFSISFTQMSNELRHKSTEYFLLQTFF